MLPGGSRRYSGCVAGGGLRPGSRGRVRRRAPAVRGRGRGSGRTAPRLRRGAPEPPGAPRWRFRGRSVSRTRRFDRMTASSSRSSRSRFSSSWVQRSCRPLEQRAARFPERLAMPLDFLRRKDGMVGGRFGEAQAIDAGGAGGRLLPGGRSSGAPWPVPATAGRRRGGPRSRPRRESAPAPPRDSHGDASRFLPSLECPAGAAEARRDEGGPDQGRDRARPRTPRRAGFSPGTVRRAGGGTTCVHRSGRLRFETPRSGWSAMWRLRSSASAAASG